MSSSSVSGGAVGDIIDLDRYMRASVRPSPPHRNERLVVDAGAVGRRPISLSSLHSDESVHPQGVDSRPKGFIEPRPQLATHKRFSHDSGVSDGSRVRRKRNRHPTDCSSKCHSRQSSMKEFRVICEQTLKEQREQIAKVTELCERLAAPKGSSLEPKVKKQSLPSSDSSELSSSTTTTSRRKHKDKHLSESCKTYKIIMTKLDELSRVFRRPLPPASSGSVSVCDKLVNTELRNQTVLRCEERKLEVTRTNEVDIAPRQRHNVLVHSLVESDRSSVCSGSAVDLEDPIQFSQAKQSDASVRGRRRTSLCSLCRSYWRSLWRCLPSYINEDV
ncbi:uncharacterized protein LOC123718573 [Pieris brassicae]|nr:uncharacterized protein LOC123718573 [Pieris brassicae]